MKAQSREGVYTVKYWIKSGSVMGYEIDFLPVGEGKKGGDAIALRYGGPRSEQTVVVVDGGYSLAGEALVEHIREYYGTEAVDLVISTHSDQDHISGLKVVLEELDVHELWMHQPWRHSTDVARARAEAFSKYSELVTASLQQADDLESIANRKGIPIREPFTGTASADGVIVVAGPEVEFYEKMLLEFKDTSTTPSAFSTLLRKAAEAAQKLIPESWNIETLTDSGETKAQNNTSVITLLEPDQKFLLLTGDAGIPALERAAGVLESSGFSAGDLTFIQVPHHGSRRNVGPTVLNRLLGERKQEGTKTGSAFVSAPKDSSKHPAKKVINAFKRRGYPVAATQGQAIRHKKDAPARSGWSTLETLPFYTQVESDEG